MADFRVRGNRFLLTYAQTDIDDFTTATLLTFLTSLEPKFAEVCREFHQDGEPHHHAYIEFHTRIERGGRIFDFAGRHPNIRPVRRGKQDIYDARNYLRKDAETEGYEYGSTVRTPPLEETERKGWGDILAESTDADNFLALAREHQPRDYVLKHFDLCAVGTKLYDRPATYIPDHPTEDYVGVPEAARSWVDDNIRQVGGNEDCVR